MIPIVERARSPIYLLEYLYFHQRFGTSNPQTRSEENRIMRRILGKSSGVSDVMKLA
jgi:hypothetical protein